MEYLHAVDLLQWKKYLTSSSLTKFKPSSHAFSEHWLAHIARQVLIGLDFLHTRMRLVHRDISTRNIMMDEHFRIKIIDLGIAKSFDNSRMFVSLSKPQWPVLTPHVGYNGPAGVRAFMDPQSAVKKQWLPSADIWSLGIVLLHLRWSKEYNFWVGDNDTIIAAWVRFFLVV